MKRPSITEKSMSYQGARHHSIHEFTCDHGKAKDCLGEFIADETEFSDAITEMKEAGWQVFQKDGSWNHVCPACVKHKKQSAWDKMKENISKEPE